MHPNRVQRLPFTRTMAFGLFVLGSTGLATLTGCAGLMGGGPHRSDQFPTGNAPEPTIATAVVACVTKALPPGSGSELTARFDALARTAMPAGAVPLSPAATVALCGTVFGSDSFQAWRETTPAPSAAAVIRELAQATGAKSIAMPAMRLYARCEKDQKTVRDANGVPIATIDENTQTCRMDRLKDIGLFLFSADGTILYRSTQRAGMGSSEDPEPQMNEVLANIPATFSAPAGGAGAMAPAMGGGAPRRHGAPAGVYAQPAAPQGVASHRSADRHCHRRARRQRAGPVQEVHQDGAAATRASPTPAACRCARATCRRSTRWCSGRGRSPPTPARDC